jgi:hypothetical protein
VAAAQRQALGRLDKAFRPLGIFFEIHGTAPSDEPAAAPLLGSLRGPSAAYMVRPGRGSIPTANGRARPGH